MLKPDLISLCSFGSWSIVSLLEEDLFHLAILQVVELPDCVLGPHYQVDQDSFWSLTLNKCMLCTKQVGVRQVFLFFLINVSPSMPKTTDHPENAETFLIFELM